ERALRKIDSPVSHVLPWRPACVLVVSVMCSPLTSTGLDAPKIQNLLSKRKRKTPPGIGARVRGARRTKISA
ncbi:MAG: hypothetical protein WA002_14135, partial [Candidatus Acidiferrales bacterium]